MTEEKEIDCMKEAWVEKKKRIRKLNISRVIALVIQAIVSLLSVFLFDWVVSLTVIITALAFAEAYNLYIGLKIRRIIGKSLAESNKALDEIESQTISVVGETRGDGHP
jgi:hypothetical protein